MQTFGAGANERIEIAGERGHLSFTRIGTTTRGLVYLSENAFHPAGASDVRIIFSKTPDGITLTVHDPEPVVIAKRAK